MIVIEMGLAFDLTRKQRVQFLYRLYEDIPAVAEIIKEDILAMASTEQGSGENVHFSREINSVTDESP